VAGDGARHDDVAGAALDHVRERRSHGSHDAVDVRPQQLVERVRVALPDVPADIHAGVGDEHIDAAVRLDRPPDEALDVLGLRHVGDDRGAALTYRGDRLVEPLPRARCDHDGRAETVHLARDRQADPRAGARDEADLALERHREPLPAANAARR
jgi:hypothetical protein